MRRWRRLRAWSAAHRLTVDSWTAAVLGVLTVPLSSAVVSRGGDMQGLALAATTAMAVALAWRRTRPALSAAVVLLLALLHFTAGAYLVVPGDALVLVALYSVTLHGPRWAYRTAVVGVLVGSVLYGAAMLVTTGQPEVALVSAFALAMLALSVFALALVRRARRQSIDALVERARRLEVERDQGAQIATAAERARIAREMHDIVAHSLSVIVAQADGGRYAAAEDPQAAVRALTTVAQTGRAALVDMRQLLGVLRPGTPAAAAGQGAAEAAPRVPAAWVPGAGTPGATAHRAGSSTAPGHGGAEQGAPAPGTARPDEPASAGPDPRPVGAPPSGLAPQPTVDDVAALVAHVRDSGLPVSLGRTGAPRAVPPAVGLTVYRIVQESLTNVLKHAGPAATATVTLQWHPRSVVLQVDDDGRGATAAADGSGHGVLGMRERTAMVGGSLSAGPRPDGGYRVRAEIPLPVTAAPVTALPVHQESP